MGTDRVGMDVFSRLISAARVDVFIALSAATLAMAVGTTLGLITGYRTTFVTEVLIRVSDLVKSFPVFVLAMLAVVATGRNVGNLVFVLAFLNAPVFHRLIHAQTLYLRSAPFIDAAQVVGNSEPRILLPPHPAELPGPDLRGVLGRDGKRDAARLEPQLRRGRREGADAGVGLDDCDRSDQHHGRRILVAVDLSGSRANHDGGRILAGRQRPAPDDRSQAAITGPPTLAST